MLFVLSQSKSVTVLTQVNAIHMLLWFSNFDSYVDFLLAYEEGTLDLEG